MTRIFLHHFLTCLVLLGVALRATAQVESNSVDVVQYAVPAGWRIAPEQPGAAAKAYTSSEHVAADRSTIVVFSHLKPSGAFDFPSMFEGVVTSMTHGRTIVDRTQLASIKSREGFALLAQNFVARDAGGGELIVQIVLAEVGDRLAGFCYASPSRAVWDKHLGEMSAVLASARFQPASTTRPAPQAAVRIGLKQPATAAVESLDCQALYRSRAATPEVLAAYLKDADARRRPGIVSGRICGDDNLAIPGAKLEVRVWGTTSAGDVIDFNADVTADGHFQQAVPEGTYKLTARARVIFNGVATPLPLRALDEKPANAEYSSAVGIVKDFRVTMFGLVPGEDPKNVFSYFGGTLGVNDASTDLFNDLNTRFGKGTSVRITLTPISQLLDGSRGRRIELDFDIARLHLNDVGFGSLPIGVYKVTANAATPDGQSLPLRVGTKATALGDSTQITWQGSGGDNEILSCPQLFLAGP